MGFTGLKSRCQPGCIPSGGSRGEFISFCLFQLLEAVASFLALWILSIFKGSSGQSCLSHTTVLLISLFLLCLPHLKGPYDYIRSTQMIQSNFHLLRSSYSQIYSICKLNPPLPRKITYSQVAGIRTLTSFGRHYSTSSIISVKLVSSKIVLSIY